MVCTGHLAKSKQLPRALSAKNANHLQTTDTIKRHQRYSIRYHCGWPSLGIWGAATHYGLPALPESFLRDCGLHRASRQIKVASKGIIRKECQSFTNHGHDKTPPTVFNPLSLWLTLPRDMGVSHTLWPHSITRATHACLWFAQEPKIKAAEPFLSDCGLHRASRQIKTASKGIIRKECQSFTNHRHDKTPPTVFNPLSLWLTLPRDMGVSHTLWPPSITRATLACPWFAQGISPNQNSRAT